MECVGMVRYGMSGNGEGRCFMKWVRMWASIGDAWINLVSVANWWCGCEIGGVAGSGFYLRGQTEYAVRRTSTLQVRHGIEIGEKSCCLVHKEASPTHP